MKELRAPWLHWHSMSASIREEALAPDDPLRTEPLWHRKESAHLLERQIVRPGIERWQQARFAKCLKDGRLTRLREFMFQVLATSTVNVASSAVVTSTISAGAGVRLPMGFFLDGALLDEMRLDPGTVPSVTGAAYLECLGRLDVTVEDANPDHPHPPFRFKGDTHFAFAVPESSYEDQLVVRSLLDAGVLTPKLAASLLMIDFSNPVFSARRAALLRYVPDSASVGAGSDFAATFVAAIEQDPAARQPGSAERAFLDNWGLSDAVWRATFEDRLQRFMTAMSGMMDTADAFEPLLRLADSRRREFRTRPLHEFDLTTPVTSVAPGAPFLELTEDGRVIPK